MKTHMMFAFLFGCMTVLCLAGVREDLYRQFGPRIVDAVVRTCRDEFNRARAWDSDLQAAVAASVSLADLKARIALLPDRPEIDNPTMLTAMTNNLANTPVYDWMQEMP